MAGIENRACSCLLLPMSLGTSFGPRICHGLLCRVWQTGLNITIPILRLSFNETIAVQETSQKRFSGNETLNDHRTNRDKPRLILWLLLYNGNEIDARLECQLY